TGMGDLATIAPGQKLQLKGKSYRVKEVVNKSNTYREDRSSNNLPCNWRIGWNARDFTRCDENERNGTIMGGTLGALIGLFSGITKYPNPGQLSFKSAIKTIGGQGLAGLVIGAVTLRAIVRWRERGGGYRPIEPDYGRLEQLEDLGKIARQLN
ncbi:MAG: hypothetical protein HY692_04345, partial [Cyanobacteria bacterium NC_groundwater_1444_Ag_S-0.65um_54_12]|nr:hypothetical protein [Cyanobacteria bacterium NC_groundwater_1444_Ag_S-0.65um_54_12]